MLFRSLEDSVLAQLKEKASVVYDMVRRDQGDELVDRLLAAIESVK